MSISLPERSRCSQRAAAGLPLIESQSVSQSVSPPERRGSRASCVLWSRANLSLSLSLSLCLSACARRILRVFTACVEITDLLLLLLLLHRSYRCAEPRCCEILDFESHRVAGLSVHRTHAHDVQTHTVARASDRPLGPGPYDAYIRSHARTHARTSEGPDRRRRRRRRTLRVRLRLQERRTSSSSSSSSSSSRSVQHLAAAASSGTAMALSDDTSRPITRSATVALAAALILLVNRPAIARHQHRSGNGHKLSGDISLWIDQQQIKMFSGLAMEIYAITEGRVQSYLLDPEFENKVPIIPSEVSYVNFTWKSGSKKYHYNFYRLKSFDETILKTPSITIKTQGRVPKRPKEFSVLLPCTGNSSGIAQFGIGLMIETRKGKPLNGTPLLLSLRKECTVREAKSGLCPDGYLGPPDCKKALCYPNCMNGGNCTAPGVCSCPPGYQGPYCEGGICDQKCLNGGKCVQKDICECPKGYFGTHCEFSKCFVPCVNGGRCKGNNICRCPVGFRGNHCEIGRRSSQRSACNTACRNGTCQSDDTCLCNRGWFGKLCSKTKPWA